MVLVHSCRSGRSWQFRILFHKHRVGQRRGCCDPDVLRAGKYAAPHGSPQAILVIAFAVLTTILIWLGDADQTVAVLITPILPLLVVLGLALDCHSFSISS